MYEIMIFEGPVRKLQQAITLHLICTEIKNGVILT